MSMQTDLAGEIIDGFSGEIFPGRKKKRLFGVPTDEIRIETEAEAERIGKPQGRYLTLEWKSILDPTAETENEIKALAAVLSGFLPKTGTIFAVGIGNEELTSDSLGAKTVSRLLVGDGESHRLCALSTGVCGKTGFEPLSMIRLAAKQIEPAAILLIDALAAEKIDRIGKAVQVTNAGLCPGSGVGMAKQELSERTLGVPVVALGLPTVIHYPPELSGGKTVFVSPGDVDLLVKRASCLLSLAVDLAVFPELGLEIIREMAF